jgi:hypothetical protein
VRQAVSSARKRNGRMPVHRRSRGERSCFSAPPTSCLVRSWTPQMESTYRTEIAANATLVRSISCPGLAANWIVEPKHAFQCGRMRNRTPSNVPPQAKRARNHPVLGQFLRATRTTPELCRQRSRFARPAVMGNLVFCAYHRLLCIRLGMNTWNPRAAWCAPVQCDVDGIPKGSHGVSVSPTG